jgi:Ca2+-binding EF-hand superfamily protein
MHAFLHPTLPRPSTDIGKLFEELAASTVYNRPDDVRAHLVEELGRIRERMAEERIGSMIFTEEDAATMFGMFDKTGRGYIDPSQCVQAFVALGLSSGAGGELPTKKAKVRLDDFKAAVAKARGSQLGLEAHDEE